MKNIKIWSDGELVQASVPVDPQIGDIIEIDENTFEITNRRFINQKLCWQAKKQPIKSVYETRGMLQI